MRKKLAIIGSGRMAWIISRNAHLMGLETHCFSNVEPDYMRDEADEFHNISIFEKDKIVEICREKEVDGVIATTELTIAVAAYVAHNVGKPGLPMEVALEITDKFRNRMISSKVIDFTPIAFMRIYNGDSVKTKDFNLPVIVKPTGKGGKKGVTVVTEEKELLPAIEFARMFSGEEPVIVEEYVSEGKEYSVESLSYNGKHYVIQITEKISSGPPHCVELGHHQPAAISEEMKRRISKAVCNGLDAIGVDNSSSHTEIKVSKDKIYAIEFNVRPGGDHIAWPLTELSTGYNYIKGAIQIALGEFKGVDTSSFEHNYAGVYFVTRQTEWLKPIFNSCERYDWLYHKNLVSDELQPHVNNDSYGTNSMIYFSKDKRIEL